MSRLSERTCSRDGCTNNISAANKTGVCTPCQQRRSKGERPGLARTRRAEAPPISLRKGESWLSKFKRLHEALGLDAEEAIETHCRTWVEATTSRALGTPAKPVKLHPRRADAEVQPDGADTGTEG